MDGYCYFFFFDLDCAAKGFIIDVFKKEKNPSCYSFHGKIKSSFIKEKNYRTKKSNHFGFKEIQNNFLC